MAEIATVNVALKLDSKPMCDSIASVFDELEALASSGDALEHVVDLADGLIARDGAGGFDLCFEGEDLIGSKAIFLPATAARPHETVQFPPSDMYLRFVSALASGRDAYRVRFVHGWPVLSVAPSTTTVREAGGESIPAGGVEA